METGERPAVLTPAAFQILLALAEQERHGYDIMQAIARHTAGTVRVGPGTLYRSIKHLLAAGWIVEAEERPDPALDDQRRRYYRLTEAGWHAAAAEAQRLERLVGQARASGLLRPVRIAQGGQ